MKKNAVFALAGVLLCLAGCSRNSSTEEPEFPADKSYPLQFCLQMKKEVLSFPSTKSIPDNPIPEPTVKAGDATAQELSELCNAIEYVVFEQGETPKFVKYRRAVVGDLDFGIVYDTLPKGKYQFYFLAHNSQKPELAGSVLNFDEVSDSFYAELSRDITAAELVEEDIPLHRAVGRIEFKAIDPVPESVNHFDMLVSKRIKQFDLSTGQGIVSESEQTLSYQFTPEDVGKMDMVHSFYTFIPAVVTSFDVKLSAVDGSGKLLRERNITGVTPEENKIIRYTGRLYRHSESDDAFQLSVFEGGKWDPVVENELPD